MLRVAFNFDRFFAGIYGRHVILKFGNASSEKQLVLTILISVLVTLKSFPLTYVRTTVVFLKSMSLLHVI